MIYIVTQGGNVGTNIYECINNGELIIKRNGIKKIYSIKNGIYNGIKEIDRRKNTVRKLVYGNYEKKWKNKKLLYIKRYRRIRSKHGIWESNTKYFNRKVKVKSKFYGGSLLWEKAYYSNGQECYKWDNNKKRLIFYSPDGIIIAKLQVEIMYKYFYDDYKGAFSEILTNCLKFNTHTTLNRNMLWEATKVVIYDKQGKIATAGNVSKGTFIGACLVKGQKKYFDNNGKKISKLEYILEVEKNA